MSSELTIPHWVWKRLHVNWSRLVVTCPGNPYRLSSVKKIDDYLQSKYPRRIRGDEQ